MSLMPAAFIGHGSPMNAVLDHDHTRAWKQLGQELPTEFFDISYPASGAPELAQQIADIAQPDRVLQDVDSWGLDHATWAVLGHMYPAADVPVVQLSVNMLRSAEQHFELGTRLAPLREQGVLVVGSGNIVHDLPHADLSRPDVVTDAPARHAEQLVSHLGRKVAFTTDGATSTTVLGPGTGRVVTVAAPGTFRHTTGRAVAQWASGPAEHRSPTEETHADRVAVLPEQAAQVSRVPRGPGPAVPRRRNLRPGHWPRALSISAGSPPPAPEAAPRRGISAVVRPAGPPPRTAAAA